MHLCNYNPEAGRPAASLGVLRGVGERGFFKGKEYHYTKALLNSPV